VGVNEDFEAGYRPKEEYEEWFQKDPVRLQREILLKQGINEDDIVILENEIDDEIGNSVRLAQAAPFTEIQELYRGMDAG
jgi:TPP-dependent pyruvate/acetoin dehydrogenase alpha subunit